MENLAKQTRRVLSCCVWLAADNNNIRDIQTLYNMQGQIGYVYRLNTERMIIVLASTTQSQVGACIPVLSLHETGVLSFIRYEHFDIQFPKTFIIIQQLSISEGFGGALLRKQEKYIENQRLKNTSIVLQISL